MSGDPELDRMRADLKRLTDEDENPFRRRHLYTDWWFVEWLPYVLVACAIVGFAFLLSWCGDMRDQDCRDKGGDHRVHVYKSSICVSKDGRIIE